MACGSLEEKHPRKSFSVSLHLNDLIMERCYPTKILSSRDMKEKDGLVSPFGKGGARGICLATNVLSLPGRVKVRT